MRRKLVWLFGAVILALVGLGIRITYINASEGNKYKKQVLSQSQQKYDSRVIPFKRGDIKDRNGAVLATSEKVYKIILDCKVVNSDEDYLEPTVDAMVKYLDLDESTILEKLESEDTKDSQYQIMKTNVSIKVKKAFEENTEIPEDEEQAAKLSKEERARRQNIKGIWFEEDYLRTYPLGSTASHLLGFTYSGNTADWGIEGYYSNTLNGVNGRQYGYFNSDADVEQTIIEPVNGNSVISTIDVNIQQTVEKHIQTFMDAMAYGPKGKKGAKNLGVVVANPNTGEILAMASDEPFDLNDPRNLEAFYSEEEIAVMNDQTKLDNLYEIWKNYCISNAFEPGSTIKPLTVGAALQSGAITSDAEYECDGFEMFGDTRIRCSAYPGKHGMQTLSDAMKNSCNDAMMAIAAQMGPEEFLKYQKIFNFGSITGIDLPGESAGIIHTIDSLSSRSTELATTSFGQGYTCTMIQEVAAFCSVINGGYYYKPHVVSKVVDEDGNTVKNMEPVVLKQTVSSDVSALIRQYMGAVVSDPKGTGRAAKVDGYSMGGKTGTAQKYPRDARKYLVSFIGFAPLENPEVVVYVVVDEPNADYQANSKYAQYLSWEIMREILPYLNIFPDEEETGKIDNDIAFWSVDMPEKAEENNRKEAAGEFDDYRTDAEIEAEKAAQEASGESGGETEGQGESSGTPQIGSNTISEGATEEYAEGTTTAEGKTIYYGGDLREGTEDPNTPAPPEDTTELDLNNKREDEGITNADGFQE